MEWGEKEGRGNYSNKLFFFSEFPHECNGREASECILKTQPLDSKCYPLPAFVPAS